MQQVIDSGYVCSLEGTDKVSVMSPARELSYGVYMYIECVTR